MSDVQDHTAGDVDLAIEPSPELAVAQAWRDLTKELYERELCIKRREAALALETAQLRVDALAHGIEQYEIKLAYPAAQRKLDSAIKARDGRGRAVSEVIDAELIFEFEFDDDLDLAPEPISMGPTAVELSGSDDVELDDGPPGDDGTVATPDRPRPATAGRVQPQGRESAVGPFEAMTNLSED